MSERRPLVNLARPELARPPAEAQRLALAPRCRGTNGTTASLEDRHTAG
jgi:hypothetical protein